MKVAIIINKSAGTKKREEEEEIIKTAFNELNIEFEIHKMDGAEIQSKAKEIIEKGIDILIAAGGDGTVSSIAGLLAEGKIPLGVLPLGTLNHFAKDIGIPMDLKDAVKVIAKGKTKLMDIAEVNGTRYINNSSICLYPAMVNKRVTEQKQNSRNKWSALFIAFISTFKKFPLYDVEIKMKDKLVKLSTPMVFVGNNKYTVEMYDIGARSRLDEGVLSLYITRCKLRFCMLKLAFLSLINKVKQDKDFEISYTTELVVKTKKKIIDVSLDGEIKQMSSPLSYKIIPKSLTVLVPVIK